MSNNAAALEATSAKPVDKSSESRVSEVAGESFRNELRDSSDKSKTSPAITDQDNQKIEKDFGKAPEIDFGEMSVAGKAAVGAESPNLDDSAITDGKGEAGSKTIENNAGKDAFGMPTDGKTDMPANAGDSGEKFDPSAINKELGGEHQSQMLSAETPEVAGSEANKSIDGQDASASKGADGTDKNIDGAKDAAAQSKDGPNAETTEKDAGNNMASTQEVAEGTGVDSHGSAQNGNPFAEMSNNNAEQMATGQETIENGEAGGKADGLKDAATDPAGSAKDGIATNNDGTPEVNPPKSDSVDGKGGESNQKPEADSPKDSPEELEKRGPYEPFEGKPNDFIQKGPHVIEENVNPNDFVQPLSGELEFPPIERYDTKDSPIN